MGAHRQGASLACQCRAVIWHESVVMGRFLVSALANSALCLVGWSAVQAHAANWCNQLVPRLPGVSHAECNSSSLAPSGAKSRRGFPILVRDIAPTSLGIPGPNKDTIRILLLGGHTRRRVDLVGAGISMAAMGATPGSQPFSLEGGPDPQSRWSIGAKTTTGQCQRCRFEPQLSYPRLA